MSINTKRVNNILFYAICTTLLIIIIVSISSFALKAKKDKMADIQKQQILEEQLSSQSAFYDEFGRIRSFTADSQRIPVVMSPILKYQSSNTPLYEEICQKKTKIQNCITSWFTDKTKKQFLQIGEENAKKQILEEINKNLSMGKVEELYFEELIFLE